MKELFKKNKILFLVVGLALAGVVWYGLSGSQPAGSSDAVLSSSEGGGSDVEQEVLDTLLELREIRLEGQIFNDPVFNSLRDFGTDIVSEPVGRDNPFAPLSAEDAIPENADGDETDGSDTSENAGQ